MEFPYKGVIFDWAWTLLDLGSEEDEPAFFNMMAFLSSRGFHESDLSSAYGESKKLFREQILTSRESLQEAHYENVLNYIALERGWELSEDTKVEALKVYYRDIFAQRKVYPQAIPTLQKLKEAGIKLGLVSNTTNPGFIKNLEREQFGLAPYFDFAIYSSEVPFRKPHPSIFYLAQKRMDFVPEKILFVGDSYEADIVGAHEVGMATAWLNRENREQPAGPIPDYQLAELDELLTIKAQMVGG